MIYLARCLQSIIFLWFLLVLLWRLGWYLKKANTNHFIEAVIYKIAENISSVFLNYFFRNVIFLLRVERRHLNLLSPLWQPFLQYMAKRKTFSFSFIAKILGWLQYFSIAFKLGSLTFSKFVMISLRDIESFNYVWENHLKALLSLCHQY